MTRLTDQIIERSAHLDAVQLESWIQENPIVLFMKKRGMSKSDFISKVGVSWDRKLDQVPEWHWIPRLADVMNLEPIELAAAFNVWKSLEPRSSVMAVATRSWQEHNPLDMQRRKLGLTQVQVADLAGMDKSSVWGCLRQVTDTDCIPHWSSFEKLCPVLDLEVESTVLKFREWKKSRPKNYDEAYEWVRRVIREGEAAWEEVDDGTES